MAGQRIYLAIYESIPIHSIRLLKLKRFCIHQCTQAMFCGCLFYSLAGFMEIRTYAHNVPSALCVKSCGAGASSTAIYNVQK